MMSSVAHVAVFLDGEFSHTQKLGKFSSAVKRGQKEEIADVARTEVTSQSSCQTTVKLLLGLQLIFSQKNPTEFYYLGQMCLVIWCLLK